MKLNWGTGIVITLVVFVASMALLVWISYQQEVNLVTDDYYIQGLKYDEQIAKQNNTAELTNKLIFEETKESILIRFPKIDSLHTAKGSILFYKPSDNRLDRSFAIKLNDSLCQIIQKKDLVRGVYTIKVDYMWGTKLYFQENSINIQ